MFLKSEAAEHLVTSFSSSSQLGFTVTNKDGNDDWRKALRVTWPFFLYYIGMAGGIIYTIVFIGVGTFNVEVIT